MKKSTWMSIFISLGILGLFFLLLPNLLRSRIRSNEASAIGSLKTIAAAETDYNNNSLPHTYTGDLNCLAGKGPSMEIKFMDPALASGLKSGYRFSLHLCETPDENGTYWYWSATAQPVDYGETGKRSFYIDETGAIRAGDILGKPGDISLPLMDNSGN